MLWRLYITVGLAYWIINLAVVVRTTRVVTRLATVTPCEQGAWPLVSHVVPACNEAKQLVPAVRSQLEEGYPRAEFILINDRSTENTGALMDQFAATDERMRVMHLDELPEGWLGEVRADRVVALGEGRTRSIATSDFKGALPKFCLTAAVVAGSQQAAPRELAGIASVPGNSQMPDCPSQVDRSNTGSSLRSVASREP